MGNPAPKTKHLSKTQWKIGQSGNPAGKPKGTIHLSTWIQELLSDPNFKTEIIAPSGKIIKYQGAPIKAIINTAIIHALQGDKQWADWLAKYGFGTPVEENSSFNLFIANQASKYDI